MKSAIAIHTGIKTSMGFPLMEIQNCSDPAFIGSKFLLNNNGVIDQRPVLIVFEPADQFCKPLNLNVVESAYNSGRI